MREHWVDYAKGIGIILVVIGHVNRGLYSSNIYLTKDFFILFDSVIYSFHMPLFFFLSGLFFIDSIDKKGKKHFISTKIKTIAYPYALWSLIQGSVEAFLSKFTNNKTDIISVLEFPLHPRAQFWFLYALLMIFILSCLIYKKDLFRNLLPSITIASFVAYIYSGIIGDGFHINFITENIVYFFAGCILSISSFHNPMPIKTKTYILALTSLAFILIQYKFHILNGDRYNNIGFATFSVAIVSIAWICALSGVIKLEALRKVGELSMVIFLMHILAGSGTRIILLKFFDIHNWFVHIVFGTAIGIVAPVIIYSMMKKLNIEFLVQWPSKKRQ